MTSIDDCGTFKTVIRDIDKWCVLKGETSTVKPAKNWSAVAKGESTLAKAESKTFAKKGGGFLFIGNIK